MLRLLIVVLAASVSAEAQEPPAVAPAAPVSASTPVPATPVPTPPPVPPAEMEQLAIFAGSWTCEGTVPGDTPHATRSVLTIERDLGGFWFAGRAVTRIAAPEPKEVTRLFFSSFDAVMKQFVGGWLDSRGEWLTHSTRGWEGDSLVFLGHLQSTAIRKMARETFTRPTEAGFTRKFEFMDLVKRQWVVLAEETCRKGKPGG